MLDTHSVCVYSSIIKETLVYALSSACKAAEGALVGYLTGVTQYNAAMVSLSLKDII